MKHYSLVFLLALLTTPSVLATSGCSDRSKKETDPVASSAGAVSPTAATPAAPPVAPGTPAPEPVAPPPAAAAPATAITAGADPFTDIGVALDNVTRETTARLSVPQEGMDRAIDAQVAAWKAKGSTNTTMAEEKLALARTDLAQKLRALSVAGDETWRNAKSEAQSSLQNLRRVYEDYLSGPTKN